MERQIPGENVSTSSRYFESNLEPGVDLFHGLSGQAVVSSESVFRKQSHPGIDKAGSGSQLVFDNPFRTGENGLLPLLRQDLKAQIQDSNQLQLSTPVDNIAAGKQPDFRLVLGRDGKLRLEPATTGDPLSDGKLNIELDTGNKSLPEAIRTDDGTIKEYLREIISCYVDGHPGRAYQSWWREILESTPHIPCDAKFIPIEETPPEYRPLPGRPAQLPPPPKEGWQSDYRSGRGPGYGAGAEAYYQGDRESSPLFALPNLVPVFNDPRKFVEHMANTILKNDDALKQDGSPRYEIYNADDNGSISVGIRRWKAGGALPELLNAWQEWDADKFQKYFKGFTPAQINAMSSSEFASRSELVTGMKAALADQEYQAIQSKLLSNWIKREIKVAQKLGLTSEKEIAACIDIADKEGQDAADNAASIGKADGDQASDMNRSVRKNQYPERFAAIDSTFSAEKAELSEVKPPPPGDFAQKLASAIKEWDRKLDGTGRCAYAVQRALEDVGLPHFLGCGNGWEMLGPLERSEIFVRVSEAQAAVGDLILRPPSADPNDDSIYGDISVITARKGNKIIQTNDATYEFVRDNPRYDGKAVFLRYVGEKPDFP
jgi:hypothetical protein